MTRRAIVLDGPIALPEPSLTWETGVDWAATPADYTAVFPSSITEGRVRWAKSRIMGRLVGLTPGTRMSVTFSDGMRVTGRLVDQDGRAKVLFDVCRDDGPPGRLTG